MAFIHNRRIGSLYRQYHVCRYRCTSKWASTERQHTINRASTEHEHSVNWVSTECQRFWVLHHVYSKGSATAYVQNERIGSRSVQMRSWHGHCTCLKMSVNRASTISCVPSCIIQGLCYGTYPKSKYWLARCRKVRRYLGIIVERYRRRGRNCVTERRRRWKTRRKRRDGGGII